MRRGIEARIIKLEAKRKPAEGLFFLAWGCSDREAVALVESMEASGKLNDKDVVVAATWPKADGMPQSRWVGTRGLSRAEDKVLSDQFDRVFGELPVNNEPLTPVDRTEMALLSDEELIAELWRDVKNGLLDSLLRSVS
jgi:hypothetical protein